MMVGVDRQKKNVMVQVNVSISLRKGSYIIVILDQWHGPAFTLNI